MASAITLTFGTGECLRLPLSNGAMSALVASLVWVGSEVIDDDPWATDVLRLLASHDIAAIGSLPILELGRLGFDEGSLFEQKALMTLIVDLTLGRDVPSSPRRLFPNLGALRLMMQHLRADGIDPRPPEWPLPRPDRVERCPRDGALLHARGCVVCNTFVDLTRA